MAVVEVITLQKSILLTPLLPNAGPTGGLGLACPAPTMSLTITSLPGAFFAMMTGRAALHTSTEQSTGGETAYKLMKSKDARS